jgi:hypothetical protein
MDRVSGFAAYGKAGPPREAQIRHGVQQHARVRVSGRREQVTSGHFNETSEVHDSDARCHVAHHREIMADEEVRQPETVLEVAHQVQHLRLHRHVERRGRLVADDEIWV